MRHPIVSRFSTLLVCMFILTHSPAIAGDKSTTWTEPVTGMEFVWVPGDSFQMGCGDWVVDCQNDEYPAHNVTVSGYWIGRYEVTQEQWQKVMGVNPSKIGGSGKHAVDSISYSDAKLFVHKLSALGKEKFRLPTEAEWEYAARSGGKLHNYAGADDYHSVSWFRGNSDGQSHPVGLKMPNLLGIYDMNGNVWEICDSVYNAWSGYGPKSAAQKSLTGPWYRVRRGGSYLSEPWGVRNTRRGSILPDDRSDYTNGVRIVRYK